MPKREGSERTIEKRGEERGKRDYIEANCEIQSKIVFGFIFGMECLCGISHCSYTARMYQIVSYRENKAKWTLTAPAYGQHRLKMLLYQHTPHSILQWSFLKMYKRI